MSLKIKAYGLCIYSITNHSIKVLLCKSSQSNEKWGFLKGVVDHNETKKQTAQREFFEESSIKVDIDDFEQYFEQKNKQKDIGIYLVNANNIYNLKSFFIDDVLESKYLSWENQKVKFFNIDNLPIIKKKQSKLTSQIMDFLRNKNLSH